MVCHSALSSEEAYADIMNSKGKKIGTATLKQGTEGIVMRLNIKGLKPGIHGMHFHDIGDCSDANFDHAGAHISTGHNHGYFNPEGPHEADLPNLMVSKDGNVSVEIYSDLVSLTGKAWKPELIDEDGSALIIHKQEDDHYSQPTGNSGLRVACGVIKLKEEVRHTQPKPEDIDTKG